MSTEKFYLIENNLGGRLKAIRKKLGLTQAAFAEPLSITGGHSPRIKRSRRTRRHLQTGLQPPAAAQLRHPRHHRRGPPPIITDHVRPRLIETGRNLLHHSRRDRHRRRDEIRQPRGKQQQDTTGQKKRAKTCAIAIGSNAGR